MNGRHEASGVLARYDWAESDDPSVEALSITLIQPADGSCLGVLQPRDVLPDALTVADALEATLGIDDFAWGSVLVQFDQLAGWDVIIEPNGWAAALPRTTARLSLGGTAVKVFWNVSAVVTFTLARAGTIRRTFDGQMRDDVDDPLPEEAGLPWGSEAPRASILAVIERVTGAVIGREWLLGRSRRTYVVPL